MNRLSESTAINTRPICYYNSSMRLMFLNINSLSCRSSNPKYQDLRVDYDSKVADIMCLAETRIPTGFTLDPKTHFNKPDCDLFTTPSIAPQHGLLMLVHKKFQPHLIPVQCTHAEVMLVSTNICDIMCIYRYISIILLPY